MRPNPYLVNGLKYATFTLAGVTVLVGGLALFQNVDSGALTGRLISKQQQGIIPTVKFDAARAVEGFSAPADTHVLFTIPDNTRIPRITFFGGPDYDEKRYWGYCFSGNETRNKEKGLTGREIYDGMFFYSLGERKTQTAQPTPSDADLAGILDATNRAKPAAPDSLAEIFWSKQTCYVMSSLVLPAGIDSDGDRLNVARERELGTLDDIPDSDADGIGDGDEVFLTKTDPHAFDTDRDGLSDRCEDENANGDVDPEETSPVSSDTDRDGLCDGNGILTQNDRGEATGCPEPRKVVCTRDENGDKSCIPRPSSPVYGEDMNLNCAVDEGETDPRDENTFGLPDWDYKWSLFAAPGM